MYEDLKIVFWPDPRLKKISKPVVDFDQSLRELTARMLEMMRQSKGVGLASPQVGLNLRLFVMNHTGQPQDDRVYANPILTEAQGEEEGEEGCLSLPGITASIVRSRSLRMQAQDLEGKTFEQIDNGYIARIWQHEFDHLNGTLLIDRMGAVARMANRRILKELEEKYAEAMESPPAGAKRKLARRF